jgi:hypothetical protein
VSVGDRGRRREKCEKEGEERQEGGETVDPGTGSQGRAMSRR